MMRFGPQPLLDRDAFLCGLLDLVGGGRHFFFRFEAVHGHGGSVRADSRSCHVHRDVAAADNQDLAADIHGHTQIDLFEELNAGDDPLRVLAFNAKLPAALRTDSDVEGFKSLCAQLRNS